MKIQSILAAIGFCDRLQDFLKVSLFNVRLSDTLTMALTHAVVWIIPLQRSQSRRSTTSYDEDFFRRKKEHEKRSLDSSAACGLHIQMSVLYWVSIQKSSYDYVVYISLL